MEDEKKGLHDLETLIESLTGKNPEKEKTYFSLLVYYPKVFHLIWDKNCCLQELPTEFKILEVAKGLPDSYGSLRERITTLREILAVAFAE